MRARTGQWRPAARIGFAAARLTMPRRSVRQRAGFSAEAFVDKMVSDAGHIWNATVRDFGIDGQIEFVDAQEQVKGFAVAAQGEGTLVGFAGENRAACRFTCKADKIDYWLAYGWPVQLNWVNPPSQEARMKRADTQL